MSLSLKCTTRMPVILEADQFKPWLSGSAGLEMLKPEIAAGSVQFPVEPTGQVLRVEGLRLPEYAANLRAPTLLSLYDTLSKSSRFTDMPPRRRATTPFAMSLPFACRFGTKGHPPPIRDFR
jgi:hypothetical protein